MLTPSSHGHDSRKLSHVEHLNGMDEAETCTQDLPFESAFYVASDTHYRDRHLSERHRGS